jgi:tRNA A-37 threonylcarbamoyl transferase component Bud32
MTTTGYACPRCKKPLDQGANFCGNCGADISGVWGPNGEAMGKTIAVEVDPNVDTLGQLLSTATLGEYDIYGELGRGGMAAVYLGLDLALNRKVAIKTMLPEIMQREGMVQRFKREAQTAAALSHPHVIQIYTVKETKQLVYFVMKFIEGRSLESVILEKGKLPLEMAQVLLSQVASALAYAHRKGVVHRDVKPANIMIDEDGWAIVTDFGIAKVQEAQNLTATGTAIGTPHYMSPEQFHNKAVTGQSDQYSLGVVAYEMLLGKKPFDGATYAEIITQHLFEPVPDVRKLRPEVPDHVAAAIQRMLAKDPAERFVDLDAAAVALGTPQKAEGDVVRTQMISLAKNGPQKKVRMSVPMSPIPVAKKTAAATVLEGKAGAAATVAERRPRPSAQPKSRAGLWATIGAVLVLGGSFAAWKMRPTPPQVASNTAIVAPAGQQAAAPDTHALNEPATKTPEAPAAASVGAVTPTTGQVSVTNAPSGAVITLDGRRQSSRQFTARPGSHDLRIEASGFEPMSRRIDVAVGDRVTVAFERRARTSTTAAKTAAQTSTRQEAPSNQGLATLRLIVTPPGAVYIDGASKGQQSRVQEELVPGTHTLRVEKEGWVTKDTVVTINVGQTATIRIQLTERRP